MTLVKNKAEDEVGEKIDESVDEDEIYEEELLKGRLRLPLLREWLNRTWYELNFLMLITPCSNIKY